MKNEPLTNIKVRLTGKDGNAFLILGTVRKALIKGGYKDLARRFLEEATHGDYNYLLRVCMKYVEVS